MQIQRCCIRIAITQTLYLLLTTWLLIACQSTSTQLPTPTPLSTPPRILILTPEQYAVGGNTLLDNYIQQAGGINAAAELEDFRQISDSQILELQPDIILFTQSWTDDQISQWINVPTYALLPALQRGHYFQLDFSIAEADLKSNEATRIDTLRYWINLSLSP